MIGWHAQLRENPLKGLWGGVYPTGRFGVRYVPFLSFAFLRGIVAAALLVALWLPQRRFVPRRLLMPLLNAGIAHEGST